jgi:predicted aspartyl protease
MKNPPASGHNLFLYGPLFEGEIYSDEISFLANKNKQGYEPYVPVKLLVDTGSNISGLDHSVVQKLNLPKYESPAEVDGVGGIHSVGLFRCVLFLGIFGQKGLPLDLVAGDYSNSPYDGIIGRDVLQYCKFLFDGPSNKFVLEAVDF